MQVLLNFHDHIHRSFDEFFEELFDENGDPREDSGNIANMIAGVRVMMDQELDLVKEPPGALEVGTLKCADWIATFETSLCSNPFYSNSSSYGQHKHCKPVAYVPGATAQQCVSRVRGSAHVSATRTRHLHNKTDN